MEEEKITIIKGTKEPEKEKATAAPGDPTGRCRIYNGPDDLAKCIDDLTEDECAKTAREGGYWGYGFAPGWRC